jgi:hypothetical protein
MRFVLGLLLALAVLTPATASCAPEPLPPQYGTGARVVVVRAPHATLRLLLAAHGGDDLAMHCARTLPPHGGMLVSVQLMNRAMTFGPRYDFAHVDEVALDESGTVIAVLLDAPRARENPGTGFVVRARYIIDVPAGEAIPDGLAPGQKVRIEADAAALAPEPGHSRPAALNCPLRLDVPATISTPVPCIPPGPSARAIPMSFEEGQLDVPVDAISLVFSIESTVDATVTLRSANDVVGPVPLIPGETPPHALRTLPPGSWHVYSTPPVGPLQPRTDYLVTIGGSEYPGPCAKRYGATLHFRTR